MLLARFVDKVNVFEPRDQVNNKPYSKPELLKLAPSANPNPPKTTFLTPLPALTLQCPPTLMT
jgi:hypothetical protein